MRPSSEGGKSIVKDWLSGGIEGVKSCNNPRPAAPMDKGSPRPFTTDDEYEDAREEAEDNSPKEPTAKDHDRCGQKAMAFYPKIYNTDPKQQRATTGSRDTRDKDGRDDRTEDRPAPNVLVTININSQSGSNKREEHAPADEPGHRGEGRRDEPSRAGQIVDSSQGPMPPQESPCAGHGGGDRKDEQRQSDRKGSKQENDYGPRTVMEKQAIGRGTDFKHSSPPRNMPGQATPHVVAPAPPYKRKIEEEKRPPSCCVVF